MMRTKKARERGHEDQEWEQRRQNRQGDVARNSPAVVLRKPHKGVVENPKDKAHPTAASCRPGLNETPGRASPLHSCTRAGTTISRLFRSFYDASLAFFVRFHYREAAPKMIKEFDNYIPSIRLRC